MQAIRVLKLCVWAGMHLIFGYYKLIVVGEEEGVGGVSIPFVQSLITAHKFGLSIRKLKMTVVEVCRIGKKC